MFTKFSIFFRIQNKNRFLRKLITNIGIKNEGLTNFNILFHVYSKTFDIIAEYVMNKDKNSIKRLLVNESDNFRIGRKIFDYITNSNCMTCSKKKLCEYIDDIEL